jgi:hypothetical protein
MKRSSRCEGIENSSWMFAVQEHTKTVSLSCDYAMAVGADARALSKDLLQSDSWRRGAARCALISSGSRTARYKTLAIS